MESLCILFASRGWRALWCARCSICASAFATKSAFDHFNFRPIRWRASPARRPCRQRAVIKLRMISDVKTVLSNQQLMCAQVQLPKRFANTRPVFLGTVTPATLECNDTNMPNTPKLFKWTWLYLTHLICEYIYIYGLKEMGLRQFACEKQARFQATTWRLNIFCTSTPAPPGETEAAMEAAAPGRDNDDAGCCFNEEFAMRSLECIKGSLVCQEQVIRMFLFHRSVFVIFPYVSGLSERFEAHTFSIYT